MLRLPSVVQALGRTTTAIEASLHDWENGILSRHDDAGNIKAPTLFASFFGRTKYQASFMDQRLDESPDEGDDLSLLVVSRKSSLPLLRDLPLDPSTICRLTSSFAKLRKLLPGIGGGETVMRVALRLLTSKNGRLLHECPIPDLVRLCEALATSGDALGRERVSLFVRRVVQLINGSEDELQLPASNMISFIWSLGELGVKYHSDEKDSKVAHRRLGLVRDLPLTSFDELQLLSNQQLSKLVCKLGSFFLIDSAPTN